MCRPEKNVFTAKAHRRFKPIMLYHNAIMAGEKSVLVEDATKVNMAKHLQNGSIESAFQIEEKINIDGGR